MKKTVPRCAGTAFYSADEISALRFGVKSIRRYAAALSPTVFIPD